MSAVCPGHYSLYQSQQVASGLHWFLQSLPISADFQWSTTVSTSLSRSRGVHWSLQSLPVTAGRQCPALVPQSLSVSAGRQLSALVPTVSANLSRLLVVYYSLFQSQQVVNALHLSHSLYQSRQVASGLHWSLQSLPTSVGCYWSVTVSTSLSRSSVICTGPYNLY